MSATTTLEDPAKNEYVPPPLPPPLLSGEQVEHLAHHGHLPVKLPERLLGLHRDLQAASKNLFDLQLGVKQQLLPASHGTELGYYHVENEKEYVTFRHGDQAKAGLESLREGKHDAQIVAKIEDIRNELEALVQKLWLHTAAYLHRMLIDLSKYIGVDPSAWDPVLDGCLALPPSVEQATPSLLRTFLYEPDRGVASSHKDNGLLTLCVGNEKGLQVWRDDADGEEIYGDPQTHAHSPHQPPRRGCWEDAQGPTVLIGTTLQLLSTNRLAAGGHRVVANPVGRQSIVFALRPSIRHVIDLEPFGGEGTWDMKALWKRITTCRVNVNAQKEIRDEQQRMKEERQARMMEGK